MCCSRTFFSYSVDGAREFGVRLGGLSGDDDVGSVLCTAQGDGLSDPPARPRDENGSSCQCTTNTQ